MIAKEGGFNMKKGHEKETKKIKLVSNTPTCDTRYEEDCIISNRHLRKQQRKWRKTHGIKQKAGKRHERYFTNVQLCNFNGSDAQKWKFTPTGEGSYYIETKLVDSNGTHYRL